MNLSSKLNVAMICVTSLLWSVAFCGCQREMTDIERLELTHGTLNDVVPVGGTITVDGQPQSGIAVILYDGEGKKLAPIRPALTDEDGRYDFTNTSLPTVSSREVTN